METTQPRIATSTNLHVDNDRSFFGDRVGHGRGEVVGHNNGEWMKISKVRDVVFIDRNNLPH